MSDSLDPIDPSTAVDLYLRNVRDDKSDATVQSHEYRLKHFVRYCEINGIDNLNDFSGRELHRYKLWREEDGDLARASLKTQMDTIRVFVRFCESIDAVENRLNEKVMSPTLSGDDNQRDVLLDADRAEDILDHLRQFEYASRDHVLLRVMWKTGVRAGGVRSLDVDDYNRSEKRLEVTHRPTRGTPLKNERDGERYVALDPGTCTVIDDWLEHERPDVTDDYGRDPLLATRHGRPHISTVRDAVYRWTRPCYIGAECPHDRDPDECEAKNYGRASKCPSSVSSHAIRRGAITHLLSEDVPETVVSDRCDVSRDVLDQHYDRRSKEVKVEQRREHLNQL